MGRVDGCVCMQVDAIGTKRFDSELSGDREVQRTMLELLSQLDGFSSSDDVKVRVWDQHAHAFAVPSTICKLVPYLAR